MDRRRRCARSPPQPRTADRRLTLIAEPYTFVAPSPRLVQWVRAEAEGRRMFRNAFLVNVSPDRGDWEYDRNPRDPHRFMPPGAQGGWVARALWRPIRERDLILFKFTSPRMDEPVGTYCAARVTSPPEPDHPDHRFIYRADDALTRFLRKNPMWPDETTSLFGQSYGPGILQLKTGNLGRLRERLRFKAQSELGLPASAVAARPRSKAEKARRDAAFARRVLREAEGRCCACAGSVNYRATGILQAAHIRGVEHNGVDHLSNGLALCPNHHAMFDRFLWTTDGRRITVAAVLRSAVRRTFREQLACSWKLDPRQLRWHQQRFRGRS